MSPLPMPCLFPTLADGMPSSPAKCRVDIRLEHPELASELCKKETVELLSLVKAAWSLVLQKFCEVDCASFGVSFVTESPDHFYRDAYYCETSLTPGTLLQDLACGTGIKTVPMPAANNGNFNTCLTIEIRGACPDLGLTDSPKDLKERDYLVELRADISKEAVNLNLNYQKSALYRKHANDIASTVEQAVICLLQPRGRTIDSVSLFSERNHGDIARWNGAKIPLSDTLVHEVFRQRCVTGSDAIAVCSWDGDLTYRQLDNLSDRAASQLVSCGVGPGVFVPVCFEKSKWAVVAVLAVLKAAGAFVPLDPSNPVSRLQNIIQQVDANLAVAGRETASLITGAVGRVVILSDLDVAECPAVSSTVFTQVHNSDPAYILFTSGSTGKPKGCLVDHAAFAGVSAASHGIALNMGSHSRVLQFASYSFGMALIEVFCPLSLGATVCIPSETERTGNLADVINRMQVTWAILTPSIVQSISPEDVTCLQSLTVAGEPLSRNLIRTWASQVRLVQAYGLTEWSGICAVSEPLSASGDPRNIGCSPNGRFWLVDPADHHQLVPVGAVGEMLLEGSCLARGYLKQPEQTNENFVPCPSWRKDFEAPVPMCLYKTGDLMRYCSDGSCKYIGRKGTLVKIRGQRVELGEVEYHVRQVFESVAKVITEVIVPRGEEHTSLAVFVLPRNLNDLDPESDDMFASPSDEFRANAQQASAALCNVLPRYMLPDFFVPLTQIPLTITSKTNRKHLREAGGEKSREDLSSYMLHEVDRRMPRTWLERALHGIFAQVLNRDPQSIGIDDSFFRLGGDSIAGMELAALCRKQHISMTMQDLFKSRTISELALCVHVAPVQVEEQIGVAFDLLPIQQMFFQASPHRPNDFSQRLVLQLGSQVDRDTVRSAVWNLVKHHSMLRARFEGGEASGWRQLIAEPAGEPFGYTEHHLGNINDIGQIAMEMQATIDIKTGPVFAAALIESESSVQYLVLVAHRLVVDEESWFLICRDIDMALDGGPAFRESPVSFHTWCYTQLEQWHEMFPAPIDNNFLPRGAYLEASFTLDEQVTDTLLGKSNFTFRTQPVDIFHAALLHSYRETFVDRLTPTLISEASGRQTQMRKLNMSNTVGWLTTTWPVQVAIEAEHDIVEVIRRTKDVRQNWNDSRGLSLASNLLEPQSVSEDKARVSIAILFRYKVTDQLNQWAGSVMRRVLSIGEDDTISLENSATPPLAMFDVSATISQGCLQFTFRYHRDASSDTTIGQWMRTCEQSLRDAASQLVNMKMGYTLTDLALSSVTHENFKDAFPCSPIQHGILLSQAKDPKIYRVQSIWKADLSESVPAVVQLGRFQDAWLQVMERHAILRTILVESMVDEGGFDQVVLKKVTPNMYGFRLRQGDPLVVVRERSSMKFETGDIPHQLTVCVMPSAVYCALTISHALIDAQSISIIMRDLGLAYDGNLPKGGGPDYRNYISYLQEQQLERSVEYWATYLKGVDPCRLPSLDYQRPSIEHQRELQTIDLELDVAARLQRFCVDSGVTIANLFQLAWALTIRCYSESEQVCFGYLTAGRDIPLDGIEDAVGPYINMLICRVDLGGDLTLSQRLVALQAEFISSCPHQHAPLGEIFKSLKLSGQLFNTMLSLRRPSSHGVSNASSLGLRNVGELDPTEYDLVASVRVGDTSVDITLSYWTTILSNEHAANLASTLKTALQSILEQPNSTPEQHNLFSEWNYCQIQQWNASTSGRIEMCAQNLIDQQTKAQPEAIAVCAWDGDFTYQELNDRASQLAAHLVLNGACPEMFIPICFEKSKWVMVAILGVIKAGAAFVLLDISHPLNRLRDICTDLSTKILISSETQVNVGKQLASSVIVVGNDTQNIWRSVSCIPEVLSVQPSNALYAVFTSGSTGKPKGVVVEHATFCTSANAHGKLFSLSRTSRVLQFSSFAFDVSISEVLTTLCFGGCICVPSEDERMDDLVGASNRLAINTAHLTPSVLRLLRPETIPTLTTVISIGEPLCEADLQTWAERVWFIPGYGPAECCIYSHVHPRTGIHSDPRNIGYPIEGLAWIVDRYDHDRLAPVGSIGELLIEGPLVARGYLNRPEKTAEAFINTPRWRSRFPVELSGRFYKTGDLVRYGPAGSMRFVGRKDTQVKLNGQRVELGEIEHHLRQCIGQSADVLVDVVYPDKPPGHPTLVAFLKPQEDAGQGKEDRVSAFMADFDSTVSEVKSYLLHSVPRYMIPAAYIPLPEFPLTNTGKTDRRRLREEASKLPRDVLDGVTTAASTKKQAPRDEKERLIQQLVARALDLNPNSVGLDDNFFDLGGQSVSAMKLVGPAREMGLHMSVKDILQQPRLTDLAAAQVTPETAVSAPSVAPPCVLLGIENHGKFIQEVIAPKTGVGAADVVDVLPTTEFQADTVLSWPYTHFMINMHGSVDKERLRVACGTLIDRHEILRTVFVSYSAAVVQVVLKQVNLPFFELECDVKQDLPTFCETVCRRDSDFGATLGHLPTRFTLFSQGNSRYQILVLRLSHAQYDGYSMPMLYQDLAATYNGTQLTSVINFSAYIHHITVQRIPKSFEFWREALTGSSMTRLDGLSLGTTRDSEDHTLIDISQEIPLPPLPTGITIASIMKAAAATLLMRLVGSSDVVFGQVVSGRNVNLAGVETIVGVCANIVPVRIQCQRDWTRLDLLKHVQAQHIQATDYEILGMQEIISNSTKWVKGTKLGCLIQHQNIDLRPEFSLSGIECTTRVFGVPYKREYLHIVSIPRGNKMTVQIFAQSELLTRVNCHMLLQQLCDTALEFSSHPHQRLAELTGGTPN